MTTQRLPTGLTTSLGTLLFGGATSAIGLATSLGWLWQIPRWTAWRTDLVPMSPAAASLAMLLGVAVMLSGWPRCGKTGRSVALLLSGFTAAVAGLLLAMRLAEHYSPLEHLGLPITGEVNGAPIGYTALGTALGFLLTAAVLVTRLRPGGTAVRSWILIVAGSIVLGAGAGLVVANLTNGPVLYDGAHIPPALNTSTCLLLLGAGIVLLVRRDVLAPESEESVEAAGNLSVAAALCAMAVATSIGGFAFYKQEVREVEQEAEQELSTIVQLRVRELENWRAERLWDGAQTNRNTVSAEVLQAFGRTEPRELNDEIFRRWLQRYFIHAEYDRVLLLDATGRQRFALPAEASSVWGGGGLVPAAMAALAARRVELRDFFTTADEPRPSLALLIPIAGGPSGRGQPLGVICLRINPEVALYRIIHEWPRRRQTAELLLVRRDGDDALYLGRLEAQGHELRQRATAGDASTLAYRAVHGAEGIARGVNYSGAPVLGTLARVPGSPWHLIGQVDEAELHADLHRRVALIIAFSLLLFVGTGTTVSWIRRGQQRAHAHKQLALSAALRESEERLRLAVTASEQAPWDLNIPTGVVTFGDEYARMNELPAGTRTESLDALGQRVHPDDAARVGEQFNDYVGGRRPEFKVEFRRRTRQGEWRWLQASGRIVARDSSGLPLRFTGMLTDIHEHKMADVMLRRSEETLRTTAAQLRGLLTNSPTIVCTMRPVDGVFRAVDVSDNIERLTGYTQAEALQPGWWAEHLAPEDRAQAFASAVRILEMDQVEHEFRFRRRDGTVCWIQDTLRCVARDASGVLEVGGAWTDITARKLAEERSQRLTALYATLSHCNQAIGRSTREEELFAAVCRAAVEHGGISLAWIGLVEPDTGRVRPAASFGEQADYLDGIEICVDPASPFGLGPTGTAIREDRPAWSEDFSHDPRTVAWHTRASSRGWTFSGSLPLRRDGRAIGALTIYTRDQAAMDDDARTLLVEMAANISYALDNFSREARRTEADLALRASVHEKDMLLKEVHHRVKNNLQLISSLLRLESGRTDNDAIRTVLGEMQGRILSMALLHEALHQSTSLAHLNLGHYLSHLARQVFRSLAPAGNLRLDLDVSDIEVDPDQAIPCGLLVNELVSNAIKHGFPGGRLGVVRLVLQSDGANRVRLEVSDDGVGLPPNLAERRASSLGLHLVTVLARQLNAELTTTSIAGTQFSLSFAARRSTLDPVRTP